jgi:hypothetical protein
LKLLRKEKGKMRKQQKSMLVLAIITAFVAAGLFSLGLIRAGELEPSAAPGPTMKTLDQIPPTWSQKLDASERFELVLDGEAVLDKETGLVWEQSPDTTARAWTSAIYHCYTREVANRKGWRLPTIEELASLVDNDNSNPALPTGHPFSNVQSAYYWSSTTLASSPSSAWRAYFSNGYVGGYAKGYDHYMWCVRGGHGHDAY